MSNAILELLCDVDLTPEDRHRMKEGLLNSLIANLNVESELLLIKKQTALYEQLIAYNQAVKTTHHAAIKAAIPYPLLPAPRGEDNVSKDEEATATAAEVV